MTNSFISRRALLQASAAVCAVSLAPPALSARAAMTPPDSYAAWIRHRGLQGWSVVCASRTEKGELLPFGAESSPSPTALHSPAPIERARNMIRADFAKRTGVAPDALAFKGVFLQGDALRVPVSIWVDFA